MPRPFVLPDLGEGLTEAEIVKVLVSEGDVIRVGRAVLRFGERSKKEEAK